MKYSVINSGERRDRVSFIDNKMSKIRGQIGYETKTNVVKITSAKKSLRINFFVKKLSFIINSPFNLTNMMYNSHLRNQKKLTVKLFYI